MIYPNQGVTNIGGNMTLATGATQNYSHPAGTYLLCQDKCVPPLRVARTNPRRAGNKHEKYYFYSLVKDGKQMSWWKPTLMPITYVATE